MPTLSRPRRGSLQFWPRKRAAKRTPSVNWKPIKSDSEGLLGFIGYKVGMATAIVKDSTAKSMTSGKRLTMPVTILEVPNMKVFSIRFYKDGKVLTEQIVSTDKELKKKLKLPKSTSELKASEGYDDLRVIAYSMPKQTTIKKKPDFVELAINSDNKLDFAKNLIGKEISLQDLSKNQLYDVRGLTKGKGLSGPVKRFGVGLKSHKSEKGVRRPGSIGPWHPAYVTFRVPMAGQLGNFTRIHYNLNLITQGSISEKDINPKSGFKHYGKIQTNYIILKGSVQGSSKRQIVVTPAFRPSKKTQKRQFEFMELVI